MQPVMTELLHVLRQTARQIPHHWRGAVTLTGWRERLQVLVCASVRGSSQLHSKVTSHI